MSPGGVETWLLRLLRQLDPAQIRMDFLVHSMTPGEYDEEIRDLGSRVIYCPVSWNMVQYANEFRRVVRSNGPYDVIHSHVHMFSGVIMALSATLGIPIRIAHSHSVPDPGGAGRNIYRIVSQSLLRRYQTNGIAASEPAAESLFGRSWRNDSRIEVMFCGIDLESFQREVSPDRIRASLGIPAGSFVMGHVGRFVPVKNHSFLIEVFREVLTTVPDAYLLLIGDGPLVPTVRKLIQEHRLEESVIFAGNRSDVAELLIGAVDCFVFPSESEGLGLALVEAQAAGCVSVVSDTVPEPATVIPELVRRLSLSATAAEWAAEVTASRSNVDRWDISTTLAESPFSLQTNLDLLQRIYRKHI